MIRLDSLRSRLLLMVSCATFLVWGIAGIASYYKALHEAGELMDGQLAQAAKLLLARHNAYPVAAATHAGPAGLPLVEAPEEPGSHPYEQPLKFQVWNDQGQLLVRSEDAPTTLLHDPSGDATGVYVDIRYADEAWRLFSLHSSDRRFLVQVAHPARDRERVALEVAQQLAIPILLALPWLSLLVYASVRRGMRPLDKLAADVGERSPDNLETLPEHGAPSETLPLLAALNRLLARLRMTLDNERRFTADAAHELRTPLTAVKLQAQVALASTDPADHQHALHQVLAGADRAARLVEQLLRLARLDPLASLPNPSEFDLAGLAAALVDESRSSATHPHRRVALVIPPSPVRVSGDAELLAVAVRNLLDNALRYTPEAGAIEVGVADDAGHPTLWVRDSGPGVDADDLPRLIERFYRGQQASGQGSGLGLAIVQRIADLHGARLEISNLATGGLEARLRWL